MTAVVSDKINVISGGTQLRSPADAVKYAFDTLIAPCLAAQEKKVNPEEEKQDEGIQ